MKAELRIIAYIAKHPWVHRGEIATDLGYSFAYTKRILDRLECQGVFEMWFRDGIKSYCLISA